eukprot:COSAG01_NODE_5841_length_4002_cov_3.100179_4_plen_78_part_00
MTAVKGEDLLLACGTVMSASADCGAPRCSCTSAGKSMDSQKSVELPASAKRCRMLLSEGMPFILVTFSPGLSKFFHL